MQHKINNGEQTMNNKDFNTIAKTMLDGIENCKAVWRKSWDSSTFACARPYNPVTKNVYKGLNSFITYLPILIKMMNDEDYIPEYRYCTFKQIADNKLSLRKGSKGLPIRYWGVKKYTDEDTQEEKSKTFVRFAWVFSFSDIDIPEGNKLNESTLTNYTSENNDINEIIKRLKIKVATTNGLQPCFKPADNTIYLPKEFNDDADGLSTVFHEMIHWTSRNVENCKRSLEYAHEELVAEIGAFMLAQHYGVKFSPSNVDNYYSYLKGWLSKYNTEDDKIKMIASALQYATKAMNAITNTNE